MSVVEGAGRNFRTPIAVESNGKVVTVVTVFNEKSLSILGNLDGNRICFGDKALNLRVR